MSLLIPTGLLALGVVAIIFASWIDSEYGGIGFFLGLVGTGVLGSVACLGYGLLAWLRSGAWDTLSIADVLSAVGGLGVPIRLFLEPVSWRGVQDLSESYLASNLGWTLLLISIALFLFGARWTTRSDQE